MIKAIILDFSRVLLFPKDSSYHGGLNALHAQLSSQKDYKFLDHFEFNQQLLEFLRSIAQHYPLYIFTTGVIQEVLEVRQVIKSMFKKVYTVSVVGHRKHDSQAYRAIAKDIGYKFSELLLIDDNEDNIRAAQEAGFSAVHFQDNKQLFKQINHLIS